MDLLSLKALGRVLVRMRTYPLLQIPKDRTFRVLDEPLTLRYNRCPSRSLGKASRSGSPTQHKEDTSYTRYDSVTASPHQLSLSS